MAPAYTSRDEDIYVGQRPLLRQGCLGRTKLHGFVVGVEKVLRTLYNIEYISIDVVMCTEQALGLYISLLNVDGRACLLIESWALMRFEPLTLLVGVIDF